MTTYATPDPDSHDSYDGPEWAAPERAERILHRPRPGGNADFPLQALTRGWFRPEEYLEVRLSERDMDRANRRRAAVVGQARAAVLAGEGDE